jgi:acetylornithine/N-succinyldiaminopimelate aminotransferase
MTHDSENHQASLLRQARQAIMFTTNRPDLVFAKGRGAYLWDVAGEKYLDFIAGWAVCALGHSHPAISSALRKQSRRLINPSPSFYNEPMIEFARQLTEVSCLDKVFFVSTGAEANEGAVKLARKYGQKFLNGAHEIITVWNSFHGRTLAMMAASGKQNFELLFLPKPEGFIRVPFNDIKALAAKVSANTCGIMLEPVLGEGGVHSQSPEYLQEVRELCTARNIPLIFDEVQTGFGRTGTLFAYEQTGIEPDIMTLAKGIGGGFPLAALLAKDRFAVFEAGDQGGTYCGTPLATAVGLAVLRTIRDERILDNVVTVGAYLEERLRQLQEEFLVIGEVRGRGLLYAIGLKEEIANDIAGRCLERRLIVNAANPQTIRFMPALTIGTKEVDAMLKILVQVLKSLQKEQAHG